MNIVDPMDSYFFHSGMKLLLAAICLFVATASISSGQDTSNKTTLAEFVQEIGAYTKRDMQGKTPLVINAAITDPELSKFPYIKTLTLGVFQELISLSAAYTKSSKDLQALQTKSNIASGNSNSKNRPQKFPKFDRSLEEQSNINKGLMDKKARSEESIEARLTLLKQQLSTPLGQQFSLSASSPLLIAMNDGMPSARNPGSEMSFEAISITEGGLLAYARHRVFIKSESPPVAVGSPAPRPKEEMVTDRSKTVFVRGYIKPVTFSEGLRIKVVAGGMKTMQGTSLREYIMVD